MYVGVKQMKTTTKVKYVLICRTLIKRDYLPNIVLRLYLGKPSWILKIVKSLEFSARTTAILPTKD